MTWAEFGLRRRRMILCEGRKLAHIGVSTHSMRILEADLAAHVRSTRGRSGPA